MNDFSIFLLFVFFSELFFIFWFIKKLVVSAIKEIKYETKKN